MFAHSTTKNNCAKSIELFMEDNSNRINDNDSPANSLESSMQSVSTYDSMMQMLNDELNNGGNCNNHANGDTTHLHLMDFEDMDFFKMDHATAMSFDYEMNYSMKQLKHIAGYYKIKCKSRKVDVIQDIVSYETDYANCDAVVRRKRLFHYMDTLKNDEYFKSFMLV